MPPTTKGGGYSGLGSFTDLGQQQAVRQIFDRLAALEQRMTSLEATVAALPPAGVSTSAMQQYVQQQVAALRNELTP